MACIIIKNIGPLKDTGSVEITPYTLIFGKQSSGKSTLMKILSFCTWFEKHLMIGEKEFLYSYTHNQRFLTELKKYHRLDDKEFSANSTIVYESEALKLELYGNKRNVKVTNKPEFESLAHNFKLSYIPSERSFLTALPNIETFYKTNRIDNIFKFILQWRIAKTQFTSVNALDVVVTPGIRFYYDKKRDQDVVVLQGNRHISPIYASSGVQSSLPTIVMANYLHSVIGQAYYSVRDYEQNRDLEKFRYRYFKLFIEEPEQNLSPESQYKLLQLLIGLLNTTPSSQLVITSHSPYLLMFTNIFIKAALSSKKEGKRINAMVPDTLYLTPKSVSAYFISDNGLIQNMIDSVTSLIRGEYIDSVGHTLDAKFCTLNEMKDRH